jgi:hypothetical protein
MSKLYSILNRFKSGVALSLIGIALISIVGCGGGVSSRYYRATWFGKLKPGLSKEEVKGLLGEPSGVEGRQVAPNDLREVWIYHVKDLDPRNHLYPQLHSVVFRDGKVLSIDPHNPYAH